MRPNCEEPSNTLLRQTNWSLVVHPNYEEWTMKRQVTEIRKEACAFLYQETPTMSNSKSHLTISQRSHRKERLSGLLSICRGVSQCDDKHRAYCRRRMTCIYV